MAYVTDGGTLSYQWYSNPEISKEGSTTISGAIGTNYTPPTGTVGVLYYYVVVTNTNNSVNGTKTASATSNVAMISVTSATDIEIPDVPIARVYPNPFTNILRLIDADGCMLRVINSIGMIVHNQLITDSDEKLRLGHLPSGLYFLRLEKDGNVQIIKVIKSRF